ncbi:MAG: molecular chaperone HtpG [Coxiella sp. (in: Bacteria)]|nr:MAG: molecular chaperone HtpG [Coxiella sp. (in: g-proteobacteria)]
MAEAQKETLSFEAETKQLLHLVAHSLYSNKEVFMRELISNSSDAADKLRYESLSDNALYEGDSELKIWVKFNKELGTITLTDNGIGMTRDEVVENLGMIARSGTRKFKELLSGDNAKDSQLIGQFGVGFYSAFIVADKVIVKTRRAGMQSDQGVYWESDGHGEYTIENRDRTARGTEITLYIKKDADEFVDAMRLRTVIRKYSDHILMPILMDKEDPEADKKKEDGETVIPEEEVVNQANALWTLSKNEITDEQYTDLYKHISHDFEAPLAWAHNRVEGKTEYISLLYIPKRAPFDLWNREQQRGLKLYVKRIFIMDDAEQLMPMYLRFVKGVVDSSDLPLNISREILQSNRTIDGMKSGCVKRVLSMLEKMAKNDADKYAEFWKEFGEVLKEGPAEDFANKDRISKLLRFSSTHDDKEEATVSLEDYIGRMKAEQKHIYYVIADSFNGAKNSPLLELFRKKDIEVLLLHHRVDEWLVSNFQEFEGKTLQSVSKGALDLGDLDDEETKEQQEKEEKEYSDVIERIKKALADTVKDVRMTHRLTSSPSCVVFDDDDMSGHMARLMQAAGQAVPETKPILELNAQHAILVKIKPETDEVLMGRWSRLLLGQALLAEGETLANPAEFVKDMNELLG